MTWVKGVFALPGAGTLGGRTCVRCLGSYSADFLETEVMKPFATSILVESAIFRTKRSSLTLVIVP